MSQSELEACMNDPEYALQHLELLIVSVSNDDESIANPALESLENCGSPRSEHFDLLMKYLSDSESQRVYWAATLIGRLLSDTSTSVIGTNPTLQKTFAARLIDKRLEESAREKICWAVGCLPMVMPELREALANAAIGASPRMQRLIESALAKA
ncbi:MAG: hypothetical protein ACK5PB_15575 [Pirellula sp.]|jgi:hypothetical protein